MSATWAGRSRVLPGTVPPLAQRAQPFSFGLPWEGQLFGAETDWEGMVTGDALLSKIPTNGASVCISTSLIIFQLPVTTTQVKLAKIPPPVP